MSKHMLNIVQTVKCAAIAAVMATPLLMSPHVALAESACAQYATVERQKQKPRKLPGLSEKFFKKLEEPQNLISPPEDSNAKPNVGLALQKLSDLERSCTGDKCNAYELSNIYNFQAYAYLAKEEYGKALASYEKVLKQSPNIPWGIESQVMFTIAQLEMQRENYDKAHNMLRKWMEIEPIINADACAMESQLLYQKGDRRNSLKSIEVAIKKYEDANKTPKEPWYGIQRALYFEREDYKNVLEVMKNLVRHYPKKSYWRQMSGIYGLLQQSDNQMHSLEATYLMDGLQKEGDLMNLAYLFLDKEVPYKTAKIIAAGMKDNVIKDTSKNLEVLATAWQQAQEHEKAIPVMKKAAQKADSGELYSRLAGIYIGAEKYKEAVTAGKRGLSKGGLKRPGQLNIIVGMAQLELKDYCEAIDSFAAARKDKNSKEFATRWRNYAESEQDRAEKLGQAEACKK